MQESEARETRPNACAARIAVERAVAEGTVEEMRQMAVSFRKVVWPMIVAVVSESKKREGFEGTESLRR